MALRLMPDTPVALWTSVGARVAEATAYRAHGPPDKMAEALERAESAAERLRRLPQVAPASLARAGSACTAIT